MLRLGLFLYLIFSAVSVFAAQIDGHVFDTMSTPVHDMELVLVSDDGTTQNTFTNLNGEFAFYNLSAGDYTVVLLAKGRTVLQPFCGFISVSLDDDSYEYLQFLVETVNGVAVDFGKPGGGVSVPIGGNTGLPQRFNFWLSGSSNFATEAPQVTSPIYLSVEGVWLTGNGDPVPVEISAIARGSEYNTTSMNIAMSNSSNHRSSVFIEVLNGGALDRDGEVFWFDFVINPSALDDLAAAGNILCFCADTVTFANEDGASRNFERKICAKIGAPSKGGDGMPGDDSTQ